jgi:hypothetical protein
MTTRKNGLHVASWLNGRCVPRLRTEALKANPELIQYTIAQKWDGKLPVQMIPGSTVPLLNLAPSPKQ